MGSKYPVVAPKVLISALEKFGFQFVSQKGSHMKYSNGSNVVIIPNHSEIAKGTLKSILSMADICGGIYYEQQRKRNVEKQKSTLHR